MIHGPGCPVCVTPLELIDKALAIAARPGRDLLLVRRHAARARRRRATCSAVKSARRRRAGRLLAAGRGRASRRENPDQQVVFFGIGFETTAPANAMAVYQAERLGLANF